MFFQKRNNLIQFFFRHVLGTGEDNGAGGLNLVVEKFAEIFHIHLALLCVYNGNGATQNHGGSFVRIADGTAHIAQLSNAGGFNDNPIRMILLYHIVKRLIKVADQRAADAAGVHLIDLYAGILQKTTVNADLTEFIFNEHQLLTLEGLLQQLLDEGGLTRTKETGNNVDSRHDKLPLFPLKNPPQISFAA